jgi:ubiquinone/menaquinone biosynthesis C-methylase UbiE
MIKLVKQEPLSHSAMECFYATFVPLVYEVAQETGLMSELAKNPVHPNILAKRLELSERGIRYLLNCLTAAGIVTKAGDRYYQIAQEIPEIFYSIEKAMQALVHALEAGIFDQVTEDGILPSTAPQELSLLGITEVVGSQHILTPAGRHYFTPSLDCYLGDYFLHAWKKRTGVIIPHLAEAVKTGRPVVRAKNNANHFSSLVKLLFAVNYDCAQQLADHLVSFENVERILDLGAGSAVWSIPLVQRKPHLQVDALDFSPVLEITRAYTQRHNVQKQYNFLSGNFWTLEDWGQGSYDLIYAGYLCCGFGSTENQNLLTKCARNLRPGGYLVLTDYFPKQDRTGPLRDVLFSIHTLLATENGDTYSPATYETWCRNAGLSELEWVPIPALYVPQLIARKPTI